MNHLETTELLERLRADLSAGDPEECLVAAIPHLPRSLELTDVRQDGLARDLADAIQQRISSAADLSALETCLIARGREVPLLLHLALKLARSRTALQAIEGPAFLSVVFAVYKEHLRILSSAEHPDGEDFLVRKVEQLEWLFGGRSDLDWEMIVVDDGCPDGSGRIAERIVRERGLGERVRVLFLEDAIRADEVLARPLCSADDSRKGGSIVLGMGTAARRERPNHVVLFTDADLSTHLGQCGLLIAPILGGTPCAIGSRREESSVVVKTGVRNERGKLFIYLWKRLLPQLGRIIDTQCGFKAFDAELARAIVPDLQERKFAFDIELLLRTELERADSIAKVPIAWIDSEALSTTTDIQPYLSMLQSAVAMYRHYLPPAEETEPFARFIEDLDEKRWDRLVANIPAEIASAEPASFAHFDAITAAELARRSRS